MPKVCMKIDREKTDILKIEYMKLEFNKNGNVYEAKFNCSDAFNLHIEREASGDLVIMQKTSGTEYAPTTKFPAEFRVFDCDFPGYIFPKEIKVVSHTKVLNAELLVLNEL